MGVSTAKGTAEVAAARVSGVGEKEDAAVTAAGQAAPEAAVVLQDRAQVDVVLQGEAGGVALVVVPTGLECEKTLKSRDKKARDSLTMLSLLITPLTYPRASSTSRGR